jgi:diadenosine tetraphosphate (Ap4A) HIT family hydrolase
MAEQGHQTDCVLCENIALWKSGQNPYIIAELEKTILVVGDHQFHRGYCQLLLKDHVREHHELSATDQQMVFSELMVAERAIVDTFDPWKMNLASFGNVVPHIHWHLIPRYADDPDRFLHPWHKEVAFKDHRTTVETALELASAIRQNLGPR